MQVYSRVLVVFQAKTNIACNVVSFKIIEFKRFQDG